MLTFINRINIRRRLILVFSSIGVAMMVAMSYVNYQTATRLIAQEASSKLVAVRETKNAQLMNLLEEKQQDLDSLGSVANMERLFAALVAYHEAANVGADAPYDVTTPEYRLIEEEHGAFLEKYLAMFGYHDLFLVCAAHGHVMFTVGKHADAGSNLKSGPYRDSGLARLWRKVVTTKQAAFEDFQPYAPQENVPAAFVGIPLHSASDEVIGMLALQISVEMLNKIMFQREGLGQTGEAYLVGEDLLMRSDSFLDQEHRTVIASFRNPETGRVDTEASRVALRGESGAVTIRGERGQRRLSAYMPVEIGETRWALLVEIDEDEALQGIATLRKSALLWGGGMTVALILASAAFSNTVTRPLKAAISVAEQVSTGVLDMSIEIASHDEIGQLLRAMTHMMAYLRSVAGIAERVGNNDLAVTVTPLSERDALNHSLSKMVTNLQIAREENLRSIKDIEERNQAMSEQNWLKDGMSQLNAALMGDLTLTDLCDRAIRFVARYVNAGRGVLYTYHAEEQTLRLRGAFAFTERDHLSNAYQLGEGAIGQVALERAPILLTHLSQEESVIHAGTVSAAPLNTYSFPLMYNEQLYGVIELASFEPFQQKLTDFLAEASRIIATAIFSAMQKDQMQRLLAKAEQATEEAERAKEEAQLQSQEAQAAAVRLEEQQQRLQQQNEELQQMNAQMEEQRQQIEQQREELRQQRDALAQAQADFEQRQT
ncbi:chemotaxis sensory transducer [Candidatus Moduliflexus flocculans]|uniref:Chemotaxis sensory transducer n=1 Tax=Candidatus Moduliflexus flocculans TaxID=1499966 RepID=A0A081BQD9_9BACT|nr:chemotaxis sensory transducer [Candidatus Moduliflexus flocculans]